jgi:hypothetical protein
MERRPVRPEGVHCGGPSSRIATASTGKGRPEIAELGHKSVQSWSFVQKEGFLGLPLKED